MFKEILHYTFKQPHMALDISGFNHHGDAIAVGHSIDGAESASGTCVFNGQNSRVHVPTGNVWQELGAIKIEALVRLDDVVESGAVGRHTISESFLSFSLFVRRADGVVGAVVLMPEETDASAPIASGSSDSILTTLLAGGQAPDPSSTITANLPDPDEPEVDFAWIGVSSDSEFAPDGVRRTVTPGIWTRIVFVHDGVSLQLWLDDVLAGYRDDVTFGVLGVQTGEVLIGAQQGGFGGSNLVLKGELDEVRIYKYDPYFLAKQFFCRPLDTRQAVCWRGLLDHVIRQWRDPETRPRVENVLNCILNAEQNLLRVINIQGAEEIIQSGIFRRRYDRLWCDGKIDGPEMVEFFQDFGEWINRAGETALDDSIAKMIGCRQELRTLGSGYDLECIANHDSKWLAYGKLISKHALKGLCSPAFRSTPREHDSYKRRY